MLLKKLLQKNYDLFKSFLHQLYLNKIITQLPILLRLNFLAKATNSIVNGTNSFANRMNSFANGTKSIAKRTNSIAKTCTYLLMPSDKHNTRTARARDLISSLIDITLSQDVPFYQLQQLQCLHHGATFVPLCAPILSSQPRKVTIYSQRNDFSARHKHS